MPLRNERAAYLQLMKQGLSNNEACRIVGINPKTGRRWRNGRNASGVSAAAPPIDSVVPLAGPSRYLVASDRVHIADRLRENATIRTIAFELGRSPSTISREIRRNRHPISGDYRPFAAQTRADARKPRPKIGKITANPQLWQFIQERLGLRWSPEQICQTLRRQFPHQDEMQVAHETIYRSLYFQGRGALRREVSAALRTGRTARRSHRRATARRPRFTYPMVMISERPDEAADRAVAGHWEGDLIIGKDSTSAIGTLVERSTRYLILLHLPLGRGAESVRLALTERMKTFPAHLVRSLTWDQGSELASHRRFTLDTQIPVYFCDPASPWQRGSNENTNGLLRQYFPKSTNLSVHDHERVEAVAFELNNRPRKSLGWDTPAERLTALLTA
ncbi:IS30 family transposase (plasmid) [Rhodococcus sp. NyZ502]|uniref:IS30 family transposase n=1 Tax=Rhodococcus sp. NyZ502 TaxID=3242855 RepID=UPI0035585F3B